MRTFKCPRCAQAFQADEHLDRLHCPACGAQFLIHRRGAAKPEAPSAGPGGKPQSPPAPPLPVASSPPVPPGVLPPASCEVDFADFPQRSIGRTYRDLAKARQGGKKKILTHVVGALVVLVLLGGGIWLLAYRYAHPQQRKEKPPEETVASASSPKKPAKPPRPRGTESPTPQESVAVEPTSPAGPTANPSSPPAEPTPTPSAIDPRAKTVSDPTALKLDFTDVKLEPWDMYDASVRRLSAQVTSREDSMIVTATVKATFFNKAGVPFRRTGEGQDPEITFPLQFIPPKASFAFYVKLKDLEPGDELALEKTTFKVVKCQIMDNVAAVKVEDVQYKSAEGDRPARVTGKVSNESSNRLRVKVRVDIVDSPSLPPEALEGGLSAGGVMAPNSSGTFELELKSPPMGNDVTLQSPRGYGEIMTGGAVKTTQKD